MRSWTPEELGAKLEEIVADRYGLASGLDEGAFFAGRRVALFTAMVRLHNRLPEDARVPVGKRILLPELDEMFTAPGTDPGVSEISLPIVECERLYSEVGERARARGLRSTREVREAFGPELERMRELLARALDALDAHPGLRKPGNPRADLLVIDQCLAWILDVSDAGRRSPMMFPREPDIDLAIAKPVESIRNRFLSSLTKLLRWSLRSAGGAGLGRADHDPRERGSVMAVLALAGD